ncbi:porin [Brevibacterium samyangense]|uniref:Uncharacterized protein n=1 Tax=Brevibacterium samyangense TaxID=366888 RepID=A0ABN2TPQ2_9MICO
MSAEALAQLSRLPGIRPASELSLGKEPFPADPPLHPVFVRGGLPRGEIVQMTGDRALTFALASVAALTRDDLWTCAIGLGEPAVATLTDLGIDLGHFVNLATPTQDWLRVTSILVESFDVLLVRPGYRTTATERSRLAAKVRERRSSIVVLEPFAGTTEQLTVSAGHWDGTAHGAGRLEHCTVTVHSSRTGSHALLLPGPSGRVQAAPARLPQGNPARPYGVPVPAGTPSPEGAPVPAPEAPRTSVPASTSPAAVPPAAVTPAPDSTSPGPTPPASATPDGNREAPDAMAPPRPVLTAVDGGRA